MKNGHKWKGKKFLFLNSIKLRLIYQALVRYRPEKGQVSQRPEHALSLLVYRDTQQHCTPTAQGMKNRTQLLLWWPGIALDRLGRSWTRPRNPSPLGALLLRSKCLEDGGRKRELNGMKLILLRLSSLIVSILMLHVMSCHVMSCHVMSWMLHRLPGTLI